MPTDFDANNETNPPMNNDFDFETLPLEEGGVDEDVWNLLSLYLDGEATGEEAAEVEALLRANPAAAREFSFLKQTGESARTYVELEPPAALRDAIFAATSHRPTLAGRLAAGWTALLLAMNSRTGRYALAGGGLMAAGLATFVMWSRPTGPTNFAVRPRANQQFAVIPRIVHPQIPYGGADNGTTGPVERNPVVRHHDVVVKNGPTGKSHRRDDEPAVPSVEMAAAPGVPSNAKHGVKRSPKIAPAVFKLDPNKIHHPQIDPADDPNAQYRVAYAPQPDGDKVNQHAAAGNTGKSGDDVDSGVQVTPRGSDGETAPKVNASVARGTDGHPSLASYRPHVDTSQLPPDPKQFLGNSEIKRERQAEALGYNRSTVDAIQRHQTSVTFVAKF